MIQRAIAILAALGCLVVANGRASAHPHVWVTMVSQLVYAPDGAVTGIRQAWTFDDMFSAFATMGIAKTGGTFTRETLQPLAKVNIDSLKDYAYFTYARIDGQRRKDAFTDPVDYWLEYDPKPAALTLHFTLPFAAPVKAKTLGIEIYDPEFFIDFGFAAKDPVALVSAPAGCKVSVDKPYDTNFPTVQQLNQGFTTSEANIGMGANFANKILVTCP
jgi:ABC-type uncharacterized transport system substrate-binding protein